MIVVADAGPLLHLCWVGAPWALPPREILVVDAVAREVLRHAPEALANPRLRRVPASATVPPELAHWSLDAGERDALALAVSGGDPEVLVLCDEREARRACVALGLPVTGSIGLIVEAFREGRAPRAAAAQALHHLPGRGRLHVRPDVLRAALVALER